jgi:hypothetical protein
LKLRNHPNNLWISYLWTLKTVFLPTFAIPHAFPNVVSCTHIPPPFL